MSRTREAGNRGEAAVGRYLQSRGMTILNTQWRCRMGELDLVARSPEGTICFVEVKLRGAGSIGLPREAVDRRKRERLRRTALLWMAERQEDSPARFDVAEVYQLPGGRLEVNYMEDAFQ